MFAKSFQIAFGSVVGRDHLLKFKNNQDGVCVLRDPDVIVAVVTDGCGDLNSLHSDVGANIGANLVANTVLSAAKKYPRTYFSDSSFWESIRQDVLAYIRVLATNMGNSMSQVVNNFFLFTIVGTLLTKDESVFFSIGDGAMFINDSEIKLGPYPANEPPYLGYALLDQSRTSIDQSLLRFKIHASISTEEVNSFLIGSDGVLYLIDAGGKKILGREENVESINQFWSNPSFFYNPYALTRRLNVLAKEQKIICWDEKRFSAAPSFLPDDTTLVVGSRLPKEGE